MILPTKHSGYDRSLLVLGAEILNILSMPKTLSRIWEELKRNNINKNYLTYEWFILSLDLLYLLNAIEFKNGLIRKVYL